MGSQWGTVQGPPRKWTLKGLSLLSEEPTAWRLLLAQICRRRDGPSPVSLALEGVGEAEALVGAAAALCSCGFSAIIWGRQCSHGAKNMPVAQRAPHECWGPTAARQEQGPGSPSSLL